MSRVDRIQSKKTNIKNKIGKFFISIFVIAFIFLLLFGGVSTVDKNIRAMTLEEDSHLFKYDYLGKNDYNVMLLGNNYYINAERAIAYAQTGKSEMKKGLIAAKKFYDESSKKISNYINEINLQKNN